MINKFMNLDSQLIYESYLRSKNPFILEGGIQDLYKHDLACIDEILSEGMLGDTLSKIGKTIGGAAKSVGSFFSDKLMKGIFDLLVSKLSKEEKDKLAGGLKNLEDPSFLQQKAKEGQNLLSQQNESNFSNKDFLLSVLFTEENISEYLQSGLLLEAKKRGKAAKISPLSKKTTQMAKEISELLQKTYKNESQRKAAYRRFNAQLLKKLGIKDIRMVEDQPEDETQAAAVSSPSPDAKPKTSGDRSLDVRNRGLETVPSETEKGGNGRPRIDISDGPIVDTEQDKSGTYVPVEKEGFLKKAYSWIKQNPNLTAAGVLALVAALTVATGGAILPIASKALLGAGITGGIEAGKQKLQTGKVDWNKVKTSALKGAAGGAVLGGVGQLVGGAASSLGGDDAGVDTDTSADTGNENIDNYDTKDYSDDDNFNAKQNTLDTYGDADKEFIDSQETQQPEQPDVDTSVSEDEFKQYNKSSYNPQSLEDQTKKFGMEQLKQKYNGKIPASKYNELAAKISKLVRTKQGLTPESALAQIDPTLFGESYTTQYLKYF